MHFVAIYACYNFVYSFDTFLLVFVMFFCRNLRIYLGKIWLAQILSMYFFDKLQV